MGFFDKLFNKKAIVIPKEYKAALSFNDEMVRLLSLDKYIARSDYKFLIEQYKDVYTFFENMKRANAISYYCKQNTERNSQNITWSVIYERCCYYKIF